MGKYWLVARQEYLKRVWNRSFLIGTLIIPVLLCFSVAAAIFVIDREKNDQPLGYVDQSQVLSQGIPLGLDDEAVEMIPFEDETSARVALFSEEIQAYFILPEDFLSSQEADLYYLEEYPDMGALNAFDDYIRVNLLPEGPNALQSRIIEGISLTIFSADGKRSFNQEMGYLAIIFPMAVALFFFFVVMGASGYFLQAITDEKENRTMEIAITSVSPWQLIGGKSVGLLCVALTQVFIWMGSIVVAWLVAAHIFPEVQGVKLPWDIFLVFLAFFIPSFALIGGVMIAIGGSVTELQEGQQISGILNLFFTFPLFLTTLIIADPNTPLLVFLSLWPTTSFLTITLRWGFTVLPWWQITLSWVLLVSSGGFMIWAASKIFHFGMLQYGQRLNLKMIIALFRSNLNQMG